MKNKHQVSSNWARDSIHFPPGKQSTKTARLRLPSSNGTPCLDLNRHPQHNSPLAAALHRTAGHRMAAGRCTGHSAALWSLPALESCVTRTVLNKNKRNSSSSQTSAVKTKRRTSLLHHQSPIATCNTAPAPFHRRHSELSVQDYGDSAYPDQAKASTAEHSSSSACTTLTGTSCSFLITTGPPQPHV